MMDAGFEIKKVNGKVEFVKDTEVVTITTTIQEFLEVRKILLSEYQRQEVNERIHKLPMSEELKHLKELYEETYKFLATQEEVRCND